MKTSGIEKKQMVVVAIIVVSLAAIRALLCYVLFQGIGVIVRCLGIGFRHWGHG